MQAVLLTCADSVAVDQRRNTLSIFHIVEEFNSAAFPFVIPHISVVAHFLREANESPEPQDAQIAFSLGEQDILARPLALNFQDRLRLRSIIEVQGVVVGGPGILRVTIRLGNRQLAMWPMVVNNVGQPVVQAELPLAQ